MMSFRNDSEAIGEEIAEQNPPTLAFYIFFYYINISAKDAETSSA